VLAAIDISEWMGGSVGCKLTDWYMLERDPCEVHVGEREALVNNLLVEVGGFNLASILLGLLDTADAWRSMKYIESTLPTKS
jgi:hypothetical protein